MGLEKTLLAHMNKKCKKWQLSKRLLLHKGVPEPYIKLKHKATKRKLNNEDVNEKVIKKQKSNEEPKKSENHVKKIKSKIVNNKEKENKKNKESSKSILSGVENFFSCEKQDKLDESSESDEDNVCI